MKKSNVTVCQKDEKLPLRQAVLWIIVIKLVILSVFLPRETALAEGVERTSSVQTHVMIANMVSLEDMLNVGVQQPQNLPAVMELAYRKGILAQPLKGVDAPELVAAAQSGDRGALLSGLFRLGYLTAETKRHTEQAGNDWWIFGYGHRCRRDWPRWWWWCTVRGVAGREVEYCFQRCGIGNKLFVRYICIFAGTG
jgi:hypothetical protein